MKILATCLGAWLMVFAVAQAGKVVCLALQTTSTAPQLEIVRIFSGPLEGEDLSTWVLETHSDPALVPSSLSIAASWPSVANRNSNPLNMKLGSATRRYVNIGLATISDIVPKDGGRFLKFDSPATGFRAALELLSTRRYDDLTLDQALRQWSNNGFGTEILAGTQLEFQEPVPHVRRSDLRILLSAMAAAEGYKSSTIADEIKQALRP